MIDTIFIFAISVIGTLVLKYQSRLMPSKYFHYSRLIDGIEEDVSFLGAMVRTSIPIIFGSFFAIVAIKLGFENSVSSYGAFLGFLIIFFLIWPDILSPRFRTPYIRRNKGKLYLLYFILILAFPSLGAIGAFSTEFIIIKHPDFLALIDAQSITGGLIAMALWSVIALIFKGLANSFKEPT